MYYLKLQIVNQLFCYILYESVRFEQVEILFFRNNKLQN